MGSGIECELELASVCVLSLSLALSVGLSLSHVLHRYVSSSLIWLLSLSIIHSAGCLHHCQRNVNRSLADGNR